MSAEVQKLLQAVEHFKARARGAELPKGAQEAVESLFKALGQPMPGRDTPGAREALKLAPGSGTGAALKDPERGWRNPKSGRVDRRRSAVSTSWGHMDSQAALCAPPQLPHP
jgi:hypothetical protein